MKLPQFGLRTLLLLMAIMGVIFVVCAQWPVEEFVLTPYFAPSPSAFNPATPHYSPFLIHQIRPPNLLEWLIRSGISGIVVLICLALVGLWCSRKGRSISP